MCCHLHTYIQVSMWDEHELKYDQHNPFDICAATYIQVSMWDNHELNYDQHYPFDICAATYTPIYK